MKFEVLFFGPHIPVARYALLLSCILNCIYSSRGPSHHPGHHIQEPLLSAILGPWNKRDAAYREQQYLLGIKRLRRLYCNVGIGFHLQVAPNGQVMGVHDESPYTLLELSPVSRGVVTLFGVRSGLFIAMTSRGKLYGSDHYQDECNFKETLLVNNYNTYESAVYPGLYIGISKTGKMKRGNRVLPTMTMTHFLPRI